MNVFISIIVACACAALGYIMSDIKLFSKIKFLRSHSNFEEEIPSLSKRLTIVITAVVFGLTLVASLFILNRVEELINVFKLMITLICLTGSACVDLREKRIPNLFPAVIAVSAVLLLAIGYFTGQPGAKTYIVGGALSAVVCIIFLTVANLITKKGIGLGDIKLLSSLGLMCGVYITIETIGVAMLLCALAAVVMILTKKKTTKGSLPFGPFILVGFCASVIFFTI